MNHLSDMDVGWLAGILEGEGSFAIRTINGERYPGVAVKMTDRDVIFRLRDVTGIGRSRGPYQPSYPGSKPQWEWGVYRRADVRGLCEVVLPMMGERRSERIVELIRLASRPYQPFGPKPASR